MCDNDNNYVDEYSAAVNIVNEIIDLDRNELLFQCGNLMALGWNIIYFLRKLGLYGEFKQEIPSDILNTLLIVEKSMLKKSIDNVCPFHKNCKDYRKDSYTCNEGSMDKSYCGTFREKKRIQE